jgi:hypothetical protein
MAGAFDNFLAGTRVWFDGVLNAASYASGTVSPGEMVAVRGKSMGPATLADAQTSSPSCSALV